MSDSDPIDRFDGAYRFLSNFYMIDVEMDGYTYRSVEHAFQAAKTLDPTKRSVIARAHTPGLAKKLGRAVALRPDWNDVRETIMRQLVVDKFGYEDMAARLLETGERELIEGNTWGDTFWGMHFPKRGKHGIGENRLGKILMDVRKEIRVASLLEGKKA